MTVLFKVVVKFHIHQIRKYKTKKVLIGIEKAYRNWWLFGPFYTHTHSEKEKLLGNKIFKELIIPRFISSKHV